MLSWQSPLLELPLIHNLRVLDVGYFLPEIGNPVLCVSIERQCLIGTTVGVLSGFINWLTSVQSFPLSGSAAVQNHEFGLELVS
jgi:hypothetical protein